jgi:hypothetical protein
MVLWLAACGGQTPTAAPPTADGSSQSTAVAATATIAPTQTVAPTQTTEPTAEPTETAEPTTAAEPVAFDGPALLQERCTGCHGLSRITSEDGTREEWDQVVRDMVSRGAKLSAEEITLLVDYLAATYADN